MKTEKAFIHTDNGLVAARGGRWEEGKMGKGVKRYKLSVIK